MHVLVELRDDPRAKDILDAFAKAMEGLGADVERWSNQDAFPATPRWNFVILWNGLHPLYRNARAFIADAKPQTLFVELGWLPQDGTFQVDAKGINAAASWANEPLKYDAGPFVTVPDGPLLVTLQVNGDVQIQAFKNAFINDREFLSHLAKYSAIPMRIRRHPIHPPHESVCEIVDACDLMEWDDSESFAAAAKKCCGVACINSTCGAEAMAMGLPVLCYGQAVYRHRGAAWCLGNDPIRTNVHTHQLKHRHCDLLQKAQEAAVARLRSHQWTLAEVPQRLKHHLGPRHSRAAMGIAQPPPSRAGDRREMKRNYILITLDSCRWDTFEQASLSVLKSGKWAKAYTHGTFTMPAHLAFFSGKLPHNFSGKAGFDTSAWVNRDACQQKPWRLEGGSKAKDADLMLPGRSAMAGFGQLGYATIGTAGVGWFDPRVPSTGPLIEDFAYFKYFDVGHEPKTEGVAKQIKWVLGTIQGLQAEQPYFLFINIGETHYPYRAKPYDGGAKWGDRARCRKYQRKALEYVDEQLTALFDAMRNYYAIVCADHGDCWGEDGLWGHGLYHERVMTVPMAILEG